MTISFTRWVFYRDYNTAKSMKSVSIGLNGDETVNQNINIDVQLGC